jgi:hypothetical protein
VRVKIISILHFSEDLLQRRSASTFVMTACFPASESEVILNFVFKVLTTQGILSFLMHSHENWFCRKTKSIRTESSVCYWAAEQRARSRQNGAACGATSCAASHIYECRVIKKSVDMGNGRRIWERRCQKSKRRITSIVFSALFPWRHNAHIPRGERESVSPRGQRK